MKRILAVDDSRINLEILEEILGEWYVVETADDGVAAIDIASQFRPDLVLLDVMMPGMDGLEACRLLRRVVGLEGTRIIMVSAKAMASERASGLDAGADDYITKPFDENDLLAMVRRHLEADTQAASAAAGSIRSDHKG